MAAPKILSSRFPYRFVVCWTIARKPLKLGGIYYGSTRLMSPISTLTATCFGNSVKEQVIYRLVVDVQVVGPLVTVLSGVHFIASSFSANVRKAVLVLQGCTSGAEIELMGF